MADMQIPKKGFHKEKISEATSVTTPTEPTVSIPGPIDLIERVAKGDGEITESREAVEALRRTEQRLRDVIDTIPTMAWTALPKGSVDFVSRSWLEYTGLPMENLLDDGWSTVAHPEDLDRTAQKWQAALVTGGSSISIFVPYHLTIFPTSSRSGTARLKHQRYERGILSGSAEAEPHGQLGTGPRHR